MRRGAILSLIAIGVVVAAAVTAVAVLVDWLPAQASEEREGIDFVFWLTTAICIFVFAIVAAVSIYAGVKFRAKPDDDSDGPPVHGHTGLEIAWTAVPAVLVTIIAIASAIVLAENDSAAGTPMRVNVTARQFAWSFSYPENGNVTSAVLRLPVGRSVELYLTAQDVIHSFWVPEFGQKQDAVPGEETKLTITPTKIGTYPVVCTELCGLGHAFMRSRAEVMSREDFAAWLAEQRQAREGGDEAARGEAVYTENGCAGCHVFGPAGSTGRVGPSLDDLASAAREAGRGSPEEFVRESIVDPNAYVAPGFPRSVMPETYADLPEDDVNALVEYLLQGSEGSSG